MWGVGFIVTTWGGNWGVGFQLPLICFYTVCALLFEEPEISEKIWLALILELSYVLGL